MGWTAALSAPLFPLSPQNPRRHPHISPPPTYPQCFNYSWALAGQEEALIDFMSLMSQWRSYLLLPA